MQLSCIMATSYWDRAIIKISSATRNNLILPIFPHLWLSQALAFFSFSLPVAFFLRLSQGFRPKQAGHNFQIKIASLFIKQIKTGGFFSKLEVWGSSVYVGPEVQRSHFTNHVSWWHPKCPGFFVLEEFPRGSKSACSFERLIRAYGTPVVLYCNTQASAVNKTMHC